ncbi:serine/threonine-protein kinase [Glaciihabitans arcticus]|nr:serine/threonine-protein kinase [Glaciihabitans arcticus]
MAIGSLFGDRYRVESLIGVGGMASVYRARDESLGRLVALKVLSGDGTAADTAGAQRQRNEVRLLASLSHSSLVTLFDAAPLASDTDDEEHLCLVMELVDGSNLGERIAAGPVSSADAAHLTADLAEGLHVVHQNGIVHRDIKPANVLLADSALPDREFRAKLADFGIASLVDSTGITATGTIIGTAAFLSPEQALGRTITPATDVYSLGLVVLEALTGRREFAGSMAESVSARLGRDPEIPAVLGADWVALLTAMTSREPTDRPTALDVSVAARGIAAGAPVAVPTLVATAVLDRPTEALNRPTEALARQTQSFDHSTQSVDQPTRVLEADAGKAALQQTEVLAAPATRVLPASTPTPTPTPTPTRRPRRALWAILAAVLLLVLTAIVIPRLMPATEAPQTTRELPVNEGELGTSLQRLLESVTP